MWLRAENGQIYNLSTADSVGILDASVSDAHNVYAWWFTGQHSVILYSGTQEQCEQVLEYISKELEPGGVSDVKDAFEERADG